MKLDSMPSVTSKSRRRVGRGYGSTVGGHTSGRGQKGQGARSKVPLWFEGGQLPQVKRLPFTRGKSRFGSITPQVVTIDVARLNRFAKGTTVTGKSLVDEGMVTERELVSSTIKILGRGELNVALDVDLPTSDGARKKIEAAGGKVLS